MNRKLMDAAKKGDVDELRNLINDDPFLLSSMALSNGHNPLHMACMGGHVRFVKEVLNLSPEFVEELNEDGLSSLHIASGRGDIEIVKEILKVGRHVCFVKGKEERIALHYAVVKGRIEVIKELLNACEDSITQVTARGQSCFHLAVKNHQFESFKILLEHVVSFKKWDVLKKMDQQGNSILHLASFTKQYEVVDLLLNKSFDYKDKLELNSLNKKGQTPLDELLSEGGDSEIEEIFNLSGATRSGSQTMSIVTQNPPNNEHEQERTKARPKSAAQILREYFKSDKLKESPSKARNTLLVIAILITTATYQAVLSPPGGVWQDDYWPDSAKNSSSEKHPLRHTAGKSVMQTNNIVSYRLFLIFNSTGFFMSLHMMNFLTVGLPLQFELNVALFALLATYNTCMVAMSPEFIFLVFINSWISMVIWMPALIKLVRDCFCA